MKTQKPDLKVGDKIGNATVIGILCDHVKFRDKNGTFSQTFKRTEELLREVRTEEG